MQTALLLLTATSHFPSTSLILSTYRLLVDARAVSCSTKEKEVRCALASAKLAQSATYQFQLQRIFKGTVLPTAIYDQQLKTVESLRAVAASITPGQTIYSIPTSATITFNKSPGSLKTLEVLRTDNNQRTVLPHTVQVDGATATITYGAPLPRQATILIEIPAAESPDGGRLAEPFSIAFNTSGGPKVTGINIGQAKASASGPYVMTLDSAVLGTQDIGALVSLTVNGQPVAASVRGQGQTISVAPAAALGRCAQLKLTISDGLQNEFGVSGGSAWSYSSRTTCQAVGSIGTSAKGRSITSYSYGTGNSHVIMVGGTHGNEVSSVRIMNDFVDYLEYHPDLIPSNRTVTIIPLLNPDGYAAGTRINGRSVDLNRNFPANNWKADVTMPDKSFLVGGGGSAPLSEPESSALASYVLARSPRMVMTYHATGGVVIPNGSGDSDAVARSYANASSVNYLNGGSSGTFFEYDTTGAFEDWLHDKHGIPTLLVELSSMTGSEIGGHRSAMINIVRLP